MFSIEAQGVIVRKGYFIETDIDEVERQISESKKGRGYLQGFDLCCDFRFPNQRWELVLDGILVDGKLFEGDIPGWKASDGVEVSDLKEPGVLVKVSAVEDFVGNEEEFDGVFSSKMLSCVYEEGRATLKYGDKTLLKWGGELSGLLGSYRVRYSYFDPFKKEEITHEITIW